MVQTTECCSAPLPRGEVRERDCFSPSAELPSSLPCCLRLGWGSAAQWSGSLEELFSSSVTLNSGQQLGRGRRKSRPPSPGLQHTSGPRYWGN